MGAARTPVPIIKTIFPAFLSPRTSSRICSQYNASSVSRANDVLLPSGTVHMAFQPIAVWAFKGVLRRQQVRVPSEELPGLLQDLSTMRIAWEAVRQRYPAQEAATAASS